MLIAVFLLVYTFVKLKLLFCKDIHSIIIIMIIIIIIIIIRRRMRIRINSICSVKSSRKFKDLTIKARFYLYGAPITSRIVENVCNN